MSSSMPTFFNAYALLSKYHQQQRVTADLAATALPANKAALFDALAAADITTVLVEFDGAGDSGQIEAITAYAGEQVVDLPVETITLRAPSPDATGLMERVCPLAEAIEAMAYDRLKQDHDGWEINDDAFGTFTFDVADRSIQLAFNARFTDSLLTEHAY